VKPRAKLSPLTERQQKLVEANLGIGRLAAVRMHPQCKACGLPFEDAVAVAYLALCIAAVKFKPAHGVKFLTYAYAAAVQKISRACAENNLIRPPHYVAERAEYRHEWQMSLDARIPDSNDLTLGDTVRSDLANVESLVESNCEVQRIYNRLTPALQRTCDMLIAGYPKSTIARAEGISPQAVAFRVAAVRRAIERMRKREGLQCERSSVGKSGK
jgi:DNA-directed RNA polymerase specialized sigma24 family protein